jgi:hypothetical protein
MKAERVHLLAFKSDEQPLEFIDPGKRAFHDKAFFVHRTVKMALAPALATLTIALVFRNIRSYTAIPKQFTGLFCVKRTIGIKVGVSIREFTPIELHKQVFEAISQLITIIMVASNHFTCGGNEAIGVRYGKNIAGFGLFSTLIGDRFAPLFAALWLPSRLMFRLSQVENPL